MLALLYCVVNAIVSPTVYNCHLSYLAMMPCHSFPHAVLHMYRCINNYPSGIHKANNNNYVPLQDGLCVTLHVLSPVVAMLDP